MKIEVVSRPLADIKCQALVLTVFEDSGRLEYDGLGSELNGKVNRLRTTGEISGRYKEFTLFHSDGTKVEKLLIMGLGLKKDFTLERLMAVAAIAGRNLRRIHIEQMAFANHFEELDKVSLVDTARSIVEGLNLGQYKFEKYKSSSSSEYLAIKHLLIDVCGDVTQELVEAVNKGEILSNSTNMVRDWVNEPANIMTPAAFADEAVKVSKEMGIDCQVLELEELKSENMHALLAVNAGSHNPAKMVVMYYHGGRTEDKLLGLVGKGITFDSGGLSIKSREAMYRMQCDMGGAGAVLGAMRAIAGNRLPVNVVAVMPLTENLIDSRSYKVSDIIQTREGKSVEILNTDAEGRLVLADALSYIRSHYNPDYLVDIATLTGAVVGALGHFCAAAMSNSYGLYKEVKTASVRSGEKVWQLPLYEDYKTQIRSDVADLENSGGKPAGAITAAMFLKEFIGTTPWVHIDIAGTAWMDDSIKPYMILPFLPREGATGAGVRLLYFLAEQLISQPEVTLDI